MQRSLMGMEGGEKNVLYDNALQISGEHPACFVPALTDASRLRMYTCSASRTL